MAQLLLDGMQKILGLLLIDVEVAVTGDAEEMRTKHLDTMEEGSHVVFDDTAKEDKIMALLLRLLREGNDSRQDARHLDDSKIGINALTLQMDDDVQALVKKLQR